MRNFLFNLIPIVICIILCSACSKEEKICGCADESAANYNSEANCDDGTCTYNGKVTFWTYEPSWAMNSHVVVTVVGASQAQTITMSYIPVTAPNYCNASGCANFTLPVGQYNYEAKLLNGRIKPDKTYSGKINIEKNNCLLVRLEN